MRLSPQQKLFLSVQELEWELLKISRPTEKERQYETGEGKIRPMQIVKIATDVTTTTLMQIVTYLDKE